MRHLIRDMGKANNQIFGSANCLSNNSELVYQVIGALVGLVGLFGGDRKTAFSPMMFIQMLTRADTPESPVLYSNDFNLWGAPEIGYTETP